MNLTDAEIAARIMAKVDVRATGCWWWTAGVTGGGSGEPGLSFMDREGQRWISVRRWLWEQHYGAPPDWLRPCPHGKRCILPQHQRDQSLNVAAARLAFRQGRADVARVAAEARISYTTLTRTLTPEDYAVRYAHRFWMRMDRSGQHWYWGTSKRMVCYQGRQRTVRQVAWLLSGRFLADDEALDAHCGDSRCERPDHCGAGVDKACRISKFERPAQTAPRNTRIVELFRQDHWTQRRIAEIYGISPSAVCMILRGAGIPPRKPGRPRTRAQYQQAKRNGGAP